jgi:glucosyl-3-phosphoglycerate synthase
MSDFAQSGLITTLQRLNDTHLEVVENDLRAVASSQHIALVLPCHARDLSTPAFAHILQELSGASWLQEIILSMNGLDEAGFARADALLRSLPQQARVLWNDRTPLPDAAFAGKGANIAAAFRVLAEEGRASLIATQDCDVASFRRADLARLCYPLVHLGYRYAKAYYPRVTDRLYGRVTRLFLTPLLHACVRVAGHHPLLDFLLSFRYPLAGEVALTREVAAALTVTGGYAVEIAQLCEVFRHLDPREVCQVDGGSGYDHRHQPATTALAAMAGEIAEELFRQLAAEGLPGTRDFRGAVADAYRREAELAVRRSAALARINSISFDDAEEREAVSAFAARLRPV